MSCFIIYYLAKQEITNVKQTREPIDHIRDSIMRSTGWSLSEYEDHKNRISDEYLKELIALYKDSIEVVKRKIRLCKLLKIKEQD